jgi:hypothetical protein
MIVPTHFVWGIGRMEGEGEIQEDRKEKGGKVGRNGERIRREGKEYEEVGYGL